MRLRIFEAPTMQAALARMREVLGPDAVIVASQEGPQSVRITAAVDTEEADLDALLGAGERSPARERVQTALHHHGLGAESVASLLGSGAQVDLADPEALLAAALARRHRFASPSSELPRSLILVGPSGAGKTATAARLAAAALLNGDEVSVVSADTERAGGPEQLASLLKPMGLAPVPFDRHPREKAADATAGPQLIVDAPGVNPFRREEMAALAELVRRSRAEPLLVLPAGLDPGDSGEIAANFHAMGARRMIATRLDAARRLGGLLAAAELGLAFGWAATGPVIGKPLVRLTPSGLARLLLARAPEAGGR